MIIRNETKRLLAVVWGAGESVWGPDGVVPVVDRVTVCRDDEAAVWVRKRRYLVDGRPVLFAISEIPAAIADGTPIMERDTGPGGVFARLADLGHAPERFRQDVTARTATADEAEHLGVEEGAAVLVAIRTAFDASGDAVETSLLVFDPRAVTLRFEFPA